MRCGCQNPVSNFNGLYRLNRHHRSGKFPIQALVPVGIGSKSRRNVVRHYFKDSADRIAGSQNGVYLGFHMLLGLFIGTVQQNFISCGQGAKLVKTHCAGQAGAAHLDHVAEDFDV
jgi:hypothetical protein